MRLYLIRHSATAGNLKRRYIGRTDEALCEEGIRLLRSGHYPEAEAVFVSPMRRCLQTAELIYPGQSYVAVEELSECDFGRFENRNYKELSGVPEYQAWIDSGGTLPFPGGEGREEFSRRCLRGFQKVVDMCRSMEVGCASLIVHGGTIMSIMERYARPSGEYYDFQVGSGEGYELNLTDDAASGGRVCAGSDAGGSRMALSPGADDRTPDYGIRANYKKMFFKNSGR